MLVARRLKCAVNKCLKLITKYASAVDGLVISRQDTVRVVISRQGTVRVGTSAGVAGEPCERTARGRTHAARSYESTHVVRRPTSFRHHRVCWWTAVSTRMEPPPDVRGLTRLDRNAFKQAVKVPALRIPLDVIGRINSALKRMILKMRNIKPICDLSDFDDVTESRDKLIMLDPRLVTGPESLTGDGTVGKVLEECGLEAGRDLKWYALELTYDNWRSEDVLKAILPAGGQAVSGFSIVGHIIHLNLTDELWPYKRIIGEVLLDKNASIRTVVNKTNTIDSQYRTFGMEVLAGEEDFIATAKENGFSFCMDFSKVYWNSRLGTEHNRICSLLQPGDVLYDVFAGIGPFSIPAAKKRCLVLANDLNPESFKWLRHNATLNKVKPEYITTYNLDGREFITDVLRSDLVQRWTRPNGCNVTSHVVMNLPALALEFLDAFVGLLKDSGLEPDCAGRPMPRVHCMCFSQPTTNQTSVRDRVGTSLNDDIASNCVIRFVRNVAPSKEMYCVTFDLTEKVLFENDPRANTESESKRRKLE